MKHLYIKFILLFIISLLTFLQCGIPGVEDYDDLNTPKVLVWEDSGSLGDGQIMISFFAYNPENNFTGYNIYMTTDSGGETLLRSQRNLHIVNNERNTTVETNYIVKNTLTGGYASIQDHDGGGVDTARTTTTQVTYTITKAPNDTALLGLTYYIGVTAFSSTNNIESDLSNVITAQP